MPLRPLRRGPYTAVCLHFSLLPLAYVAKTLSWAVITGGARQAGGAGVVDISHSERTINDESPPQPQHAERRWHTLSTTDGRVTSKAPELQGAAGPRGKAH